MKARLVVALIAVVEAGVIAFFALGALTANSLGRSIALGMSLLMAGPFLLLTLPALLMVVRDRWPWAALALAAASLVAMAVLWRVA